MENHLRRPALIAAIYFLISSLTIALTRFSGGFAVLWFATAFLASVLLTTPKQRWLGIQAGAVIGSALSTGLWGLGWKIAFPLALINVAEGYVAAMCLHSARKTETLGSSSWLIRFLLGIGVVTPMCGASAGSLLLLAFGRTDFIENWVTWYLGHALGSLTFMPLGLMVCTGEIGKAIRSGRAELNGQSAFFFAMFNAVTIATFAQRGNPLLFAPVCLLVFICLHHGRLMPALCIVCLAIIGGVSTLKGHGPISLASTNLATMAQFYQFYLACVVITILPIVTDLRNRRRLTRLLLDSDARFKTVLDNSSDVVLHLRPDGRIIYASASAGTLTGHSIDSLLGTNALLLVEEEWRPYVQECHQKVIAYRGRTFRYEYLAQTSAGPSRWYETSSKAILDPGGAVQSVISFVRDVHERKIDREALLEDARTDFLTGLPNRRAFQAAFDGCEKVPCALAIVDIDHFKTINDEFGHAGGDCALQTFAEVAKRVLGNDKAVFRIGGEEFALMLNTRTMDAAFEQCELLRTEVAGSITFFGSRAIRYTVSIGLVPTTSPDLAFLMKRADEALYRAKRDGRDRLRLAA